MGEIPISGVSWVGYPIPRTTAHRAISVPFRVYSGKNFLGSQVRSEASGAIWPREPLPSVTALAAQRARCWKLEFAVNIETGTTRSGRAPVTSSDRQGERRAKAKARAKVKATAKATATATAKAKARAKARAKATAKAKDRGSSVQGAEAREALQEQSIAIVVPCSFCCGCVQFRLLRSDGDELLLQPDNQGLDIGV